MTEDGYEHPASRYRAMTFNGPEAMASARESVTEAMNRTFGVKSYTTTEGWFVGGLLGNGEVNKDGPQSSPAWRQRVEKARREIEEHQSEHRVRNLAASLRPSVVAAFLRSLNYG